MGLYDPVTHRRRGICTVRDGSRIATGTLFDGLCRIGAKLTGNARFARRNVLIIDTIPAQYRWHGPFPLAGAGHPVRL